MILKDIPARKNAVYEAEVASGVATMRPLATIHDAQVLADFIIKERFWKNYSIVRKVVLSYVPHWDRDASCGWLPKEPRRAEMELSIGSLCEGTVYHEMAHLDRRDKDDGHRFAFLRLQFAIMNASASIFASVLLPRYAIELRARKAISGNEPWALPWVNRKGP